MTFNDLWTEGLSKIVFMRCRIICILKKHQPNQWTNIYPSIYLIIYSFHFPSISLYIHLSMNIFSYQSIIIFNYPTISQPLSSSKYSLIHLFILPSIYLSIHLHIHSNFPFSINNMDKNVHRFALRAIRGEILEREGERERLREIHTI